MSADHIVLAGRLLLGGIGTGFQITAGLTLMHGVFIPWAALGLILFTIVASVMLINFWDKQGEDRIALTNAFQNNIGLLAAAQGLRP